MNKKFTKEREPDSWRCEFDYGLVGMCLDKVKDWVIDLRDRLGADVRVTTNGMMKEQERPLNLSAYAVQEIHYPKVPSKFFSYFSTGEPAQSRCVVLFDIRGFPVTSNHLLEWIS